MSAGAINEEKFILATTPVSEIAARDGHRPHAADMAGRWVIVQKEPEISRLRLRKNFIRDEADILIFADVNAVKGFIITLTEPLSVFV